MKTLARGQRNSTTHFLRFFLFRGPQWALQNFFVKFCMCSVRTDFILDLIAKYKIANIWEYNVYNRVFFSTKANHVDICLFVNNMLS